PLPCRPFTKDRMGFTPGIGAAFLVLETVRSAAARGAEPLAEIAGFGASCDAYHITSPDPDGHGMALAMQRALHDAGIGVGEVDYINAHGTGTYLNDHIETLAIKRVRGARAPAIPARSTKALGGHRASARAPPHAAPRTSTRPIVGHTPGGSAALEAAICCLAVRKGVVPPTVHYDLPDPECDLDYVPNASRARAIGTALSNSFAFGGNNSTLVVRRFGTCPDRSLAAAGVRDAKMGLRAEKKNKLRGEILANAIQLFKERGFDEVTIDDIIGRLEISQATFFNYFPSKDAILEQAAEDTVGRYREMLEHEVRRDAPTAEKVRRLLEAMGRGIQADKRFYRALFTRSVLTFGNVRAARMLSDLSAALLREGQRRGEIGTEYDPHELAEIFIGTYYAIIIRWLHGDGGQSLTERLHHGAAIFLSGVAAAPLGIADRRPPGRRAGAHS